MEETAAGPGAKAVPDAPSIARAVAQFAITGLAVLGLFLVGSVLVFRSFGRSEALRDARQYAVIAGQGIVEPALRNGVLRSDPGDSPAPRPARPGARARRPRRPRQDLERAGPRSLLGRAAADRGHVPARGLEASRAANGQRPRRAERPQRRREPLRARRRQPVRGVLADSRPERHPAPVRDVPARSIRRADGTPDLAPVRRPPPREPLPPLARASAARVDGSHDACVAVRRTGRHCSSELSRPPPTSGGGSRPTSTTASSRISPALSYSLDAAADKPTRSCRRPPARSARGGRSHA